MGMAFVLAKSLLTKVLRFYAVVFIIIGVIVAAVFLKYAWLWLQAKRAGASLGVMDLIKLRLHGVSPDRLVEALTLGSKAGIDLDVQALVNHHRQHGRIVNVVRALIEAKEGEVSLTFDRACRIDLARRNVVAAVIGAVNPKVIRCPDASVGRSVIDAEAGDGVKLRARAQVTIRTNLDRLVGGATEETVSIRVAEAIANVIGFAADHKKVLANPNAIARQVLEKHIDAGTAFDILAIDVEIRQ